MEEPQAGKRNAHVWFRASGAELAATALGLGAAAGAVAAITYLSMIALQELIWTTLGPSRWVIMPVTLLGGVLIAVTLRMSASQDLEGQIAEAREPETVRLRETWWCALGAVVAVAFGGAIGPEAGIIAVTAQLSAGISIRLGRTDMDRRTLAKAGVAGALSGFYGSPAGGPFHAEQEGRAPKAILFLAGISGFAAFVILAEQLRDDALELMWLPRLTAEAGRWDALIALLPAAAGSLVGALYLSLRGSISKMLNQHLSEGSWQPIAGGAALGLLCTAAPILLFSGHGELHEMLRIGYEDGPGILIVLAAGKALACAICISSRWRGGVVFPMCFAGGALGAATVFVLPGFDPVLGVASGMAAAAAVGMTRPLVAGLFMLFILGGGLAVPVFVGALVGWGVLRLLPKGLIEAGSGHDGH